VLARSPRRALGHASAGRPRSLNVSARARQAGTCTCGAPIGNKKGASAHTMAGGNKFGGWTNKKRATDRWGGGHMVDEHGKNKLMTAVAGAGVYEGSDEVGYPLNDASTQGDKLATVRGLSPTTLRLLRFFMHGRLRRGTAPPLRPASPHPAPPESKRGVPTVPAHASAG
jgi:hypothetical protein